jgi:hypothetical protein
MGKLAEEIRMIKDDTEIIVGADIIAALKEMVTTRTLFGVGCRYAILRGLYDNVL